MNPTTALQPLPDNIQNDLLKVNECLENILHISDNSNRPPAERFFAIKEWAIEALKKLPVNNNEIATKYS